MQILIGCAKTMTGLVPRLIAGGTEPAFQRNADGIALRLARYSADELQAMLHCSAAIAKENWFRFRRLVDPSTRRPAVFSYDGMVYKKIDPESMDDADLKYANEHLLISSFLYGLLRPLDLINQYRLEGKVELPGFGGTLFDYWKPILTDWLIDKVKADDGVLVDLASNEFKDLFDWKKVKSSVKIISPQFRVEKAGKLKTVVVYAKMCRGAMTRWILMNRISDPEQLRQWEYEGFRWDGDWNFNLKVTD